MRTAEKHPFLFVLAVMVMAGLGLWMASYGEPVLAQQQNFPGAQITGANCAGAANAYFAAAGTTLSCDTSITDNGSGTLTATTFSASTLTSTVATGTAPLTVSSTTVVPNLNVSTLGGKTFAAPGPIGGTTPAAGTFTTVTSGTAGTTAGFIDVGIGVTTSAMATQNTNAAVNITGMTWTTLNSKNYLLRCDIPMTLTTTATLAFSLANSSGNAATSYSLDAQGGLGVAGVYAEINTLAQTAFGTKTSTSPVTAATTVVKVWAEIQNAANSGGTLTLQTWDVAASGTIQVLANAVCTLTQEN